MSFRTGERSNGSRYSYPVNTGENSNYVPVQLVPQTAPAMSQPQIAYQQGYQFGLTGKELDEDPMFESDYELQMFEDGYEKGYGDYTDNEENRSLDEGDDVSDMEEGVESDSGDMWGLDEPEEEQEEEVSQYDDMWG